MATIKISDICSNFFKGFTKTLEYINPRVHLVFNTYHEKIIRDAYADPNFPGLFHCQQSEEVDNDENILSLTIKNYNANTDTNVEFNGENMLINITPNNKNFIQKEGSACFSHTVDNHFIDITKHKNIILTQK